MLQRGVLMTLFDYQISKEWADELNALVRQDYPDHADAARDYMNTIFRRYDKRKYLVFNGEADDRDLELGEMSSAHRLISELLKRRDEGIEVPEWYLENTVRTCLGMGFTLIHGDQDE